MSGERRRTFSRGTFWPLRVFGLFFSVLPLAMLVIVVGQDPFMGLVIALPFLSLFILAGAALTFGRVGVTFDADAGTVTRWWGIAVPWIRRRRPLSVVERIVLQPAPAGAPPGLFTGGGGAYLVAAAGAGGLPRYPLGTFDSTEEAFRVAVDLARLLAVALKNTVAREPIVIPPEELPVPNARDVEVARADRALRARDAWADRHRGAPTTLFRSVRLYPLFWPALAFFAFGVAVPVWLNWDRLTGRSGGAFLWGPFVLFPAFGTIPFWISRITRRTVLDTARGLLVQRVGVGPFGKRRAEALARYEQVRVDTYSYTVNETRITRYTAGVAAGDAMTRISDFPTKEEARAEAEILAGLLGLPVDDRTA